MSFDPFVKKSEIMDISFYLYADPQIDIFVHAEDETTVKGFIDQRNQFLRNIATDAKEQQAALTYPDNQDIKGTADPNTLISKADIEKIAEEKAKGNDSIEITDGVAQIVFKEGNMFQVKLKVKQPNAAEVTNMISAASLVTKEGLKIDFNRYNEIRIHQLLKGWNFQKEDNDGKLVTVPVNEKNISALNPKVFNALVFYLNLKVDMYLDNLLY